MINIINAIEEKLKAQQSDIYIKDIQIKQLQEENENLKKELAEVKAATV